MEQPRESTGDLDAMDGRRWSEFLPGGKAAGELLEHGDHGSEGEEDAHEDGGGSLHSLQSHVSFASLPSYMRSKSGMEMDPDRVSSTAQSKILVAQDGTVSCTTHHLKRASSSITVSFEWPHYIVCLFLRCHRFLRLLVMLYSICMSKPWYL